MVTPINTNLNINSGSKVNEIAERNLQVSPLGMNRENAVPAPALTVTHAAPANDIESVEVPEEALRRDDALGQLVNRAFSFSPPPPPEFK